MADIELLEHCLGVWQRQTLKALPRGIGIGCSTGRHNHTRDPARHGCRMDGVRVYAIGDIHGRSDLLERQHSRIEADFAGRAVPIVHLVYLGDYIDRGPSSRAVLEILAQGASDFVKVTLLRGNHEEMLLRFLDDESVGPSWCQLGGLETLRSYGIDVGKGDCGKWVCRSFGEFQRKTSGTSFETFNSIEKLFCDRRLFFCHAGVRPGIALDRQQDRDLAWIREKFLDTNEDFGMMVVHGHSPVDQPDFRKNRINIDTCAYATGWLTCLVLEGSTSGILWT